MNHILMLEKHTRAMGVDSEIKAMNAFFTVVLRTTHCTGGLTVYSEGLLPRHSLCRVRKDMVAQEVQE